MGHHYGVRAFRGSNDRIQRPTLKMNLGQTQPRRGVVGLNLQRSLEPDHRLIQLPRLGRGQGQTSHQKQVNGPPAPLGLGAHDRRQSWRMPCLADPASACSPQAAAPTVDEPLS